MKGRLFVEACLCRLRAEFAYKRQQRKGTCDVVLQRRTREVETEKRALDSPVKRGLTTIKRPRQQLGKDEEVDQNNTLEEKSSEVFHSECSEVN